MLITLPLGEDLSTASAVAGEPERYGERRGIGPLASGVKVTCVGEHFAYGATATAAAPSPAAAVPYWRAAISAQPAIVILVTMAEVSSIADAKAHLSDLVARVGAHHERVTVTVHGRPTAVLLAVDDLEALEETIAVLSNTDAMNALQAADRELAHGEGESETDLAAAMAERRTRA